MNGRFYMILIFSKNISQYMQGSALHKHRTFYIAISPGMNTLDHGEILLTCFLQCRLDARFVARLYDQKFFASSHHNINKLRVKLATGQDASLVRLPPSEAALRQHISLAKT
jgi:hypothetical protein